MSHFDLLTQICLIVISGLLAVGFAPVGVARLIPVKGDKRKLLSGISFIAIGVIGTVLFGVLLLFR